MAESAFTLQTVKAANSHKDLRVEVLDEDHVRHWLAKHNPELPDPEGRPLLLALANKRLVFAKDIHLFTDRRVKAPEGGILLAACLIPGARIKTATIVRLPQQYQFSHLFGSLTLLPEGMGGVVIQKDQPVAVLYPFVMPTTIELQDVTD